MNVPDKIVIECPQCSNQYEIEVAAISEAGTNLKCSSCEHEWAVKKVIETDPPSDQETEQKPQQEEKSDSNNLAASNREANLSRKPEYNLLSRGGCLLNFVLIPVIFFMFGAFVVASRHEIINVVPAINTVYEMWGIKTPQTHLSIVSSEAILTTEGDKEVLRITGEIANTGKELVSSLPLRVVLLNASKQIIAEKFVTLSPSDFSLGAKWKYQVDFNEPPSDWHSHEVSFVGVSRVQ